MFVPFLCPSSLNSSQPPHLAVDPSGKSLDLLHADMERVPQGYQRASLVSLEELALIKKIDRQPVARQQVVFEREAETYASLFLALLGKLVRIDTVQAVLVGMGDMLTGELAGRCDG